MRATRNFSGSLARILSKLTLALVLSMIAMLVFVKLAHEVGEQETRQFDTTVLRYFQTFHHSPIFKLMEGISWLAGGIPQTVFVIFAISILYWHHRRREALSLLIGSLGGLGLIIGLKYIFQRPRPEEVFSHLGYSFPSGHAFFALTLYGLMAYWLVRDAPLRQRVGIWFWITSWILLVGLSRVFVGEHFPSDVAAGYLVALPWVWGCLALPDVFIRDQ